MDCRIFTATLRWRLPSIPELASLIDPTQSNPAMSLGHPFINVQSSFYWSVTTNAARPEGAWGVVFLDGFVATGLKINNNFNNVWCVRGGMTADTY